MLQIYLLVSGGLVEWHCGIPKQLHRKGVLGKGCTSAKKAIKVPNEGEQGRTETTTIVGVLAVQNQDKCATCSKLFINDTLPMFNI